eukprot:2469596-Rhodomonas_salina.1
MTRRSRSRSRMKATVTTTTMESLMCRRNGCRQSSCVPKAPTAAESRSPKPAARSCMRYALAVPRPNKPNQDQCPACCVSACRVSFGTCSRQMS